MDFVDTGKDVFKVKFDEAEAVTLKEMAEALGATKDDIIKAVISAGVATVLDGWRQKDDYNGRKGKTYVAATRAADGQRVSG